MTATHATRLPMQRWGDYDRDHPFPLFDRVLRRGRCTR